MQRQVLPPVPSLAGSGHAAPRTGLALASVSHHLQPVANTRVRVRPRRFHQGAYDPKAALVCAVGALKGRLSNAVRCPSRLGRVALMLHVEGNHWVRR